MPDDEADDDETADDDEYAAAADDDGAESSSSRGRFGFGGMCLRHSPDSASQIGTDAASSAAAVLFSASDAAASAASTSSFARAAIWSWDCSSSPTFERRSALACFSLIKLALSFVRCAHHLNKVVMG